jgi:hypothetical protein
MHLLLVVRLQRGVGLLLLRGRLPRALHLLLCLVRPLRLPLQPTGGDGLGPE